MATKHFTENDKYALDKGIETLNEKLYFVKNLLLGGNVGFMEMITGEDGSISDRKVETLSDEMVTALEEYRSPYGEPEPGEIPDNYHREGNMIVPDENAPRLDPMESGLYKSFAYCAIYVAANERIANGTFGDLLDIAANSAHSIGDKIAASEYSLSTTDILELLGNCAAVSFGADVLSEYYDKEPNNFYWDTDIDEENFKDTQSWKNTVSDPDKFIAEFKKYVKLRHEKRDIRAFDAEREYMILTFLCTHGLSSLASDVDYGAIENIVDNFCQALKTECGKKTEMVGC